MFVLLGEEGNRESHNNPTEFLPDTPAAAYIYLKTGLVLSGSGPVDPGF